MRKIDNFIRRRNLIKLANYFKQRKKLKAKFDMYDFTDWHHMLKDTCGTVGCAVGHGPYAGIPKSNQTWVEYSQNFVENSYSSAFQFLFGGAWRRHDNTKIGVVRRIAYYLTHGVPKDFKYPDKKFVKLYRGYENLAFLKNKNI